MSYNPTKDLPNTQMYRDISALGFYDQDSATLIRGEMRTYQYGSQVFLELIDSIRYGWWPMVCAEVRLEQWEELLKLPPRPRATLDQHRPAALLSLGMDQRTPADAAQLLAAAGIYGTVREDHEDQRLIVTVERFSEEYDSIYQCMDRARGLLPAQLEIQFEFGGPDWDEWEQSAGTWSAFDAADLTWQQRDCPSAG